MKLSHLHIGAGKIGLGLVCEVARDAGFNTVILNHKGTRKEPLYSFLKEKRQYTLKKIGHSQVLVDGVNLHLYSDSSPEECAPFFTNPGLSLVTTAVKAPNLRDAARVIMSGLLGRMDSIETNELPLAVIPCENIERPASALEKEVKSLAAESGVRADLSRFMDKYVAFANSIVDRMCVEPVLVSGLDSGVIEVTVEPHREWIIDGTSLREKGLDRLQRILASIDGVRIVSSAEFDVHTKRKFWCFNGIDLCAAAYAYRANRWLGTEQSRIVELADALGVQRIAATVHLIQEEFAQAVAAFAKKHGIGRREFQIGQLRKFNERVFERMAGFRPNPIDRILSDFIMMTDKAPAIAERLVSMVGSANQNDHVVRETIESLSNLTKALETSSLFRKLEQRLVAPIRQLIEARLLPKNSVAYLSDLIEVMTEVSDTCRRALVLRIGSGSS